MTKTADGDHELIRRLHDAINKSVGARLKKDEIIERLRAENARLRREAEALRDSRGVTSSALPNGQQSRMSTPDGLGPRD